MTQPPVISGVSVCGWNSGPVAVATTAEAVSAVCRASGEAVSAEAVTPPNNSMPPAAAPIANKDSHLG